MAALTTTIIAHTSLGNKRGTIGTFTGSGTGGEIDTGLRSVEAIVLTPTGSSVCADQITVNETMPCDGSAVTIIHTSGLAGGSFFAIGY